MPIYYKLQPITDLLTTSFFPDIREISEKQSALKSALDDYCSNLAITSDIACDGYPPDPAMPGPSIVQGFYANGQGDPEPVNPYTKGLKTSVSGLIFEC